MNYADNHFKLSFLKAECLEEHSSRTGKSVKRTFYFCESFQMGQEANRLMQGVVDKRYRNAPLKEVFKNEGPVKNIELNISYSKTNPTDNYTVKEIKFKKKLVKLGVYNIPPIHGIDPARKAHPNRNPLLTFLDSESHKMRMNLTNDPQFSKNAKNIQEALCDSFYVYSYINEVEIEVPNGKGSFPVLIDGRLYGDFSRIKITRLTFRDGKRLTVPIATFTDIDKA